MATPTILSPDILKEFNDQPQQRRAVLISCTEDIKQIRSVMEQAGILITGQMSELRILQASIDYDDLIKILKIPGIESIEFDEEVQTF